MSLKMCLVFNIVVSLSLLWWVVFTEGFGNCPFEVLSCIMYHVSWWQLHQIYPPGSYNLILPPERGYGSLTCSELHYRRATLSWGNLPLLYQAVSKPFLCPRRRHKGCVLQTQTWEMAQKNTCQGFAEFKHLYILLSPKELDKMSWKP